MVIFVSNFLLLHLVWVRNGRKGKGKAIGKDIESTGSPDLAYIEARRKTVI